MILVPVDVAGASAEAIGFAISIAHKSNGRILLVHAIALNLAEFGPAGSKQMKMEERREMERELGECVAFSKKAGVPANYIIEEGSVANVIDDVAQEQHPALIVLASRKAGPLARLVSRRTVKRVIKLVDCPVMVVQADK